MIYIKLFENFDSEMKLKENIKRLSSFSYPNGKVKITLRLMSNIDNPLEVIADNEDDALTELADLVTFYEAEDEVNNFIDGLDNADSD